MFGKLVDGALVTAPKVLLIDGMKVWNASAENYASLGWYPVVYTDSPETDPWHYAECFWEQDEHCIRQKWTVKEIPEPQDEDEIDDAQVMSILMGETV